MEPATVPITLSRGAALTLMQVLNVPGNSPDARTLRRLQPICDRLIDVPDMPEKMNNREARTWGREAWETLDMTTAQVEACKTALEKHLPTWRTFLPAADIIGLLDAFGLGKE